MTFYHLYTIAGLIMALMLVHRLLRGPRCNHKWEVVVERELPPPIETIGHEEVARWNHPCDTYAASRKKFYAILRCTECPETREFSTLNGGEM